MQIILNSIVFKDDLDKGISQAELLSKVQALSVENFEIRSEYLQSSQELYDIKQRADELHIQLFYSVNEDLFINQQVNPRLPQLFAQAQLLGAPFIKLNIGDVSQVSAKDLTPLKLLLQGNVGIRVENNQTKGHANLDNCHQMMALVQQAHLPISFVFDTANWVFVGDNIAQAVLTMAPYTSYLHCKNYQHLSGHPLVTSSLFEGAIHIDSLIQQFKFVECIALEYASDIETLTKDLAQLRKILDVV